MARSTALILLLLIVTVIQAQEMPYQPPDTCVERQVRDMRGQLRVQRFCYMPGPYGVGWYPVSDKHPCTPSRKQVLTPKKEQSMPYVNKPLDCDPNEQYICCIYRKVNNVRKLVRVGTTWRPLGFFTAVHSGQEMIAYVATDDPEKRLLCTLADWQQRFRRVPKAPTAPEPAQDPKVQEAPAVPKKGINTQTRGLGV